MSGAKLEKEVANDLNFMAKYPSNNSRGWVGWENGYSLSCVIYQYLNS